MTQVVAIFPIVPGRGALVLSPLPRGPVVILGPVIQWYRGNPLPWGMCWSSVDRRSWGRPRGPGSHTVLHTNVSDSTGPLVWCFV